MRSAARRISARDSWASGERDSRASSSALPTMAWSGLLISWLYVIAVLAMAASCSLRDSAWRARSRSVASLRTPTKWEMAPDSSCTGATCHSTWTGSPDLV